MFISQNPGLEALWISSKEKRWLVTKKRFKDDVNLDFKGSLASIAIDMEPYFLSKVALSSATYAIGLFSVEHAFEQALPKQPQGIEFFIRNQGGSFFHIHQSRTGDPINRNIRHEMKFEIMGTKWDMAGFPTVNMTALYKTNVPYMAAGVVFAFFVLLSGFMLIIMYLALISTSNNELKKGIIELAEIIIVLSRKIT